MFRLFRWLLPIPLVLACCLPLAHAQTSPASTEAKDSEKSPPVAQYALAVLFTILVLVIICKPSRKSI